MEKVYDVKKITNSILMGDCIDILKRIPDNSIDLVFADPPYRMQTEGELLRTDGSKFSGVDDEWDSFNSDDEYDKFTKDWLTECKRVLKPNGSIWVIGSFQNIYRLGYIMSKVGLWIINDIVWAKPNAVPNFAGTRFQNSHETLLWCVKDRKAKYTFNYKTMKYLNGGKQDKSVWEIGICIGNERLKDRNGKKVHSTQKPEKLLYKVILSSSKEQDIILDPFFGTGTTGAVAKRLKRNFIGIEREQSYIDAATQRIASIKPFLNDIEKLTLEVKPPRVSMQEIIKKGYLKDGQWLYAKNGERIARLNENGNVNDGENELSIHKMSAKKIGRKNNNGWTYFYYKEDDGNLNLIDNLRYRYMEDENGSYQ